MNYSISNNRSKLIRQPGSFIRLMILLIACCSTLTGCYSFKGYSISEEAKTYFVGNFRIQAANAPATINQTFTEALKDKISRESRLKLSDQDPHLEFNGSIQSFNVNAVAPQPGERTAFNRLTIAVNIEYVNHLNPKDQWTRSFSYFEDFAANENLLNVQDQLIELIFTQLLEDIFNHAFNNW